MNASEDLRKLRAELAERRSLFEGSAPPCAPALAEPSPLVRRDRKGSARERAAAKRISAVMAGGS